MLDIAKLKVGDKVHYQPSHYEDEEWENGIIKEIREENPSCVWVVYHCADDWDNYTNYTSAQTKLLDLKPGWRTK